MRHRSSIPIIDLFAGPGGLGEGFSAYIDPKGKQPFKIALSIEKDPIAHQTLRLRLICKELRHAGTRASKVAVHPVNAS
jgi:DNA (cytosine-5)-methyltransferase 1